MGPIRPSTSLAAFLLLSISASASAVTAMLTRPDIHGDMVAFQAEGDIWIGNLKDGTARRATTDSTTETNPRFSPDGKMLAFTAQYDGGQDVYVMPVEGGQPKRLTFDPRNALVEGWTPDGNGILFRSNRNLGTIDNRLWVVPVGGGTPSLLPVPTAEFGSIAKDGTLAYVPVSWEWANWFRYQGGSVDDIWLTDQKGSFKKFIADKWIATTPTWCGQWLFYVSEKSGSLNLWRKNRDTGQDVQVSHYSGNTVRYPSSDGDKVIFEHDAGLAVYDPKTDKLTEVSIDLNSDRIHERPRRIAVSSLAANPSIGPKAKRIAIEARGQIVTVPVKEGELRVLVNQPGARAKFPTWSPDGKRVAFISDASGENEIWVANGEGGGLRQLTTGIKANPGNLTWSPGGDYIGFTDRESRIVIANVSTGAIKVLDQGDRSFSYDVVQRFAFSPNGKLVAFTKFMSSWNTAVFVADIASGKQVQVSPTGVNSFAPSFDIAGKYVMFLADTELNPTGNNWYPLLAFDNTTRAYMATLAPSVPSPFLVKNDEEGDAPKEESKEVVPDLDGIGDRLIQIPVGAARYAQINGLKDGQIGLLNQTDAPGLNGGGEFEYQVFNATTKSTKTLVPSLQSASASNDGSYIVATMGSTIAPIDVSGDNVSVQSKAVKFGAFAITVDPREEWKQVFHESWRIARDFFYDPGMHGADWNAVEAKYKKWLPYVGDRTDLTRILTQMVSEFNSGHAYITDPTAGVRSAQMGYLGADYEVVTGKNAVRIKRLLKGDSFTMDSRSPLLEPGLGVKEGDYILEINGQPVASDQEVQQYLIGQSGQIVSLRVNSSPDPAGSRLIRVKTLSNERSLRYWQWYADRAAYVDRKSGGRLGYVHMKDMTTVGADGFVKGQLPNTEKEGMIYDTRDNSGGFISSLMLQFINTTPQVWWKPRFGTSWTREGWANAGPKVAICNEGNFSDGELFIEVWKRLGLGPVVGKRTGGGEVGSGAGYALVDGGLIYPPAYGAYADGKWVIEGHGVDPTVEVDQDQAALMRGEDPQLDKAIQILLDELAKKPVKRPVPPPFPNKSKTGSQG